MAYTRVNWKTGKTGGTKVGSTNLNQMDKGIYDNSVNIEAIKEKNTTQDERLDTLETSSQDYQERITILEDENQDLYNNQLSSNATGEIINVKDSASMKTKRLKVKGYTKQDGTPTPDAPIDIDVVEGINLFDKDNATLNQYINSTGGLSTEDEIDVSDFIEVSNETYYFGDRGGWTSVALYDENKNFISRVGITSTYTFDSLTKYIRVNLEHKYLDTLMINKGSIAKPYVPFNSVEVNSVNKNLLSFNDFVSKTINGVTITNNNDGSITLNGTSTDVISERISDNMSNLAAGTYAFKRNSSGTVSGNFNNILYGNNGTATNILSIGGESTYITNPKIDFSQYYLWIYINSGITFTNYTMKPQLEVGTLATSIEQHQENSVIYSLKQDNLFDKDNANIMNASINGNTGIIEEHSNTRSIYIPVKPNTTYTMYRIVGTRFVVGTTTDIPTVGLTTNSFKIINALSKYTFTTGTNDNYLVSYCYINTDTFTIDELLDSIKIYEGIPNEDGTNFMAEDDYIEDSMLNKEWGKVVFDGSDDESWKKDLLTDIHGTIFSLPKDNMKANEYVNLVSDYFTPRLGASYPYGNGVMATGNSYFNVCMSDITTVEDFKANLQSNPVTIYYPLANPYKVQLKQTGELKTYKNVSNISNSEDADMDIDYYVDLQTKINELSSAVLAVGGDINV